MPSVPYQSTQVNVQVNTFIRSVYNWMAVGLALTGAIAWGVANSPDMVRLLFGNQILFFGLVIIELGLVFFLSARIAKIQASTATTLFVAYSALNGLTLAAIFFIYTRSSIASVFFVCAATFVATSVFGWVSKKDLTGVGNFMFMGLIGIIIASVINIFLKSPGMNMIISYIGVIVFVGLTAYDTQKLKRMAVSQPVDASGAMVRKGAILGALALYLDFINLFLMLLQILGNRK